MGGTKVLRTALLAGGAFAATAFGVVAVAQEADAPLAATEPAAAVDFSDPEAALQQGARLNLSVREDVPARFETHTAQPGEVPRRFELELAAGGGNSPLDVSIAQRASLGADSEGDTNRRGQGSELRVGQGLVEQRREGRNSTYVFVASENEALTWQPGSRSEFGGQGASFAVQDRVEVGDLSAGVTWEREGVQTSLTYVEREESTRVGNQSFSQDQSFAGVTVTMRR